MATTEELFNSGRALSQDEADALIKFCGEHGLAVDGKAGENNGKEIAVYIVDRWKQRITPATLEVAVKELKDRLTFLTPPEAEYNRVASQSPQSAQQLVEWLNTQRQLVNTPGDQTFENLTLLLSEISSRREAVSAKTIGDAINRISNRPGRKLHYVEAPRRTEPQSRAALADSDYSIGKPFSGSDLIKQADGSLRNKNVHEQRRDREAAEAAKAQTQTSVLDSSEAAWKRMADGLLQDGTHSQQQRVKEVYDREQGNSWRHVYEMCKKEASLYRNRSIR
jgi:hypothetical protein